MKQNARIKQPTAQQLQQDQLQSLGGQLRQVRLQKNISLEAIEERTLIRQTLLGALEQGNLSELPEPIYVRALLRRYGNALGLDGESVASQFFTRPVVQPPRSSWKDSPTAQLRPFHLYGAYVLLIMGAVMALSGLVRRDTSEFAKPIVDQAVLEQLMPKETQVAAIPTAAEAPKPKVQARPVELDLALTGQSWVRVIADGKTEFEAILEQGETRSWAADRSITVRVGNAGGVMFSYNDSEAAPMGELGMPEERTFGPKVSMATEQ